MRILCIDVGTGTQDILLYDSSQEMENCVQLIMPSPTQIVSRRVKAATAAGHTLLLTGVTLTAEVAGTCDISAGMCHYPQPGIVMAGIGQGER